jgi:hypothetical protein
MWNTAKQSHPTGRRRESPEPRYAFHLASQHQNRFNYNQARAPGLPDAAGSVFYAPSSKSRAPRSAILAAVAGVRMFLLGHSRHVPSSVFNPIGSGSRPSADHLPPQPPSLALLSLTASRLGPPLRGLGNLLRGQAAVAVTFREHHDGTIPPPAAALRRPQFLDLFLCQIPPHSCVVLPHRPTLSPRQLGFVSQ